MKESSIHSGVAALYRLGAVLRSSGSVERDDDPRVQEAAVRALADWSPATPRDSSIAIDELARSIETHTEYARIAVEGIRMHAKNTNNWLSPVAELLEKLRFGELARVDDASWLRAELTSILLSKPSELSRHIRRLIPGLIDPNPGIRSMTLSAIKKGVDRPLFEDEAEALTEVAARALRGPLDVQACTALALIHVQERMRGKHVLAPLFRRLEESPSALVRALLKVAAARPAPPPPRSLSPELRVPR